MKNSITIVMLGLALFSFSQENRGSFLFGGHGDVNFGFSKPIETPYGPVSQSYVSFNLLPNAGYFITNRLVLGATLQYSFLKRGETLEQGLNPGVFARYYILNPEKKFNIIGQARYSTSNLAHTEVL